jgi:hypothetical protein
MNNENLSKRSELEDYASAWDSGESVFEIVKKDELVGKQENKEEIRFPSCPDRW